MLKRHPDLSKEEQYAMAIGRRPGYSDRDITFIIDQAKSKGKVRFNFQYVVICLIMYEYINKIGKLPTGFWNDVETSVKEVIPKEY